MSRADAFDAFYREAHNRLLHQIFVVSGSVETARQSVSDAFVAAAHHWRKVGGSPDRDAWVRQHAVRAVHRHRSMGTSSTAEVAEPSRRLLQALNGLSESDRHLLAAHLLAGLELASAAREVGLTDEAARASLTRSTDVVVAAGFDLAERSLAQRLGDLQFGVRDVRSERPRRLRREGNRRRRSHLALAGTAGLALAIGAGALTADKPEASAVIEALPGTTSPSSPAETPQTFEQPDFTTDQLTSPDTVGRLDPDARWRIINTSADFGMTKPLHPCLTAMPVDPRAKHVWVRELSTARPKQPTAVTEMLEVSRNAERASKGYDRLVASLATCPRGGYEVTDFATLTRIGDDATMVRLAHADRRSVDEEQLVVARTGRAVVAWLVQAADRHPVPVRRLVGLLSQSTNDICGYADGECAAEGPEARSSTPPHAPRAAGFLGAVDLPLLKGLRDPWVATEPKRTRRNPAATECDRADFTAEGATRVRSRSYVVPTADQVATIFGMTQTVGEFRSADAARDFVKGVRRSVATCNDRQLSLEVASSERRPLKRGSVDVWVVRAGTSESKALTFRMTLVRVGSSVTQLTFTPTRNYDVSPRRYDELARRAADRLNQL
jgi:DNA-directed RNA polymerase specialized sigma24 family protein